MSAAPLLQLPADWARIGDTYRASQGTRYVAIAGTHGWRDGWATDDHSEFSLQMHAHNFHLIRTASGDPFQWSGDLNGLLHRTDWQAGAMALAYFLDKIPYADRNLIAHSHGGQVVFHYVALGRKIRTLTTVGTPPRSDVPMLLAKPYIGFHQHIYDLKVDWWGWFGQVGEGDLDKSRRMPYADLNVAVKDISHSKILRDADYIPLWFSQGWAERLSVDSSV